MQPFKTKSNAKTKIITNFIFLLLLFIF